MGLLDGHRPHFHQTYAVQVIRLPLGHLLNDRGAIPEIAAPFGTHAILAVREGIDGLDTGSELVHVHIPSEDGPDVLGRSVDI